VAETKEKRGITERIKRTVRDMRGELKRVVWPSRKQAINNTGIVLVFMAIMAVIIGVFDTGLTTIIRLILGTS
jgi:preprotein translocase subunit SecE